MTLRPDSRSARTCRQRAFNFCRQERGELLQLEDELDGKAEDEHGEQKRAAVAIAAGIINVPCDRLRNATDGRDVLAGVIRQAARPTVTRIAANLSVTGDRNNVEGLSLTA